MIVILLLVLIVVFALWLRWNEPHMIYYPDRRIDQTPDQAGLKYDDVTLTTSDDLKINGWFLPASASNATLTVLLFHGNAGNMSHRFEKLAVLHSLGVNAFIIDYRGYGRSEGAPDEQGTYRDSQAAYNYLIQQRKLPPRSVVLYGESLGSAIAADLAARVDVGGLIIEEAFTSIGDVGQKMFPFLPVRWLVRNKYDTLGKMPRIKVPLLIFHSHDDELFNMRHAQRLLAAANDPKQLVELRGHHNDAFLVSAATYHDALQKFFASLTAKGRLS
ncbi:MAG TPA: alpha/beta hydrolase [Verrucomicrobiae bacterium]|nr:alpha/beta hydrolase [Verrucomicrobiae bacterium]